MQTTHKATQSTAGENAKAKPFQRKDDAEMNAAEVRALKLQCIEMAAKTIAPSNDGAIAIKLAADYYRFVIEPVKPVA
jgi:uncharacterized protein involved in high-affinity Fe2+ transport